MGKKKESPEEMMRRVFTEGMEARDRKASDRQRAKEDPTGYLEDMVRRVFNEEYDKRGKKSEPDDDDKGDDDKNDGGFFAKIVGGA